MRALTVRDVLPPSVHPLLQCVPAPAFLDVIIVSLRTIIFRSIFSMEFGVLVIMIENMVGDLVLFLELFVLVSAGFIGFPRFDSMGQ